MLLNLVKLLLFPFKVGLHLMFDVMDWLILDETPVFGELPEKEKPKNFYAQSLNDVIDPRGDSLFDHPGVNVVQGDGYVSLEPPLRRWSSVPIDGEYFDENTIFGQEEMLRVYGIYLPQVRDNTEWTKNMIQYLDDQGLSGDDR